MYQRIKKGHGQAVDCYDGSAYRKYHRGERWSWAKRRALPATRRMVRVLILVVAMTCSRVGVAGELAESGRLAQRHTCSNGSARMAWGRTAKAYAGTDEEVARQFLRDQRPTGRAAAKLESYRATIRHRLLTGSLVILQQEYDGLPVFNGSARVLVAPDGHVTHFTDETAIYSTAAPEALRLSFDDAITAAKQRSGEELTVTGAEEIGYWVRSDQLEPAYRVTARITDDSGRSIPHRLVISALTGDTLEDLRLVTERWTSDSADQATASEVKILAASPNWRAPGGPLTDGDRSSPEASLSLIEGIDPVTENDVLPLEPRKVLAERAIPEAHETQSATGESVLAGDNDGAGWDIPDESYVIVGGRISDVPDDAVVTGLSYSLQISPDAHGNSFFAGDYEIFLTTERLLQQNQGVRVYAPDGWPTDGGRDDDPEDDEDILLWNRTTTMLNNESAAEAFYVLVFDRFGADVGNLNFVELHVSWASGAPEGGTGCSTDGPTRVFDPNPITTTGTNAPGFPDQAYVQARFDELLGPPENGAYVLKGPYCQILDIEAPSQVTPTSDTTDFGYAADASCFAANMCFYHIGKSIERLRSLGFDSVFPNGLRSDYRGVDMDINAHYAGDPLGAGYVAFGMGYNGRPIAEDGDVILHEFGHALQDNQNPGAFFHERGRDGLEPGAVTEGFGDYWTFSMTYDANMNGPLQDPDRLAEWAFPESDFPGGMRRTDSSKTFPGDWVGEVHDDGEIWSAALVEIFRAIGRDAADRVIVTSSFLVPSSGPTFHDASLALLAADDQLYGGTHSATICSILASRGLFDGACATEPPVDDQFEENDSPAQATPIGPGTLHDLIADDEDWYRLDLNEYTTARLATSGSQGDLDLLLVCCGDTVLAESTNSGVGEQIEADLAPGTYYVVVVPVSPDPIPYSLSIDLTATDGPVEDDQYEENDTWDDAARIGAGTTRNLIGQDEDWYRVDLDTAAFVATEITGSGGDLDLYLYDRDLVPIDASEQSGVHERVEGDLPAGTIYIAVVPIEPGATYDLSISIAASDVCNSPAPCGAGCAAAIGVSMLGLLGFCGSHRRRFASL